MWLFVNIPPVKLPQAGQDERSERRAIASMDCWMSWSATRMCRTTSRIAR